MITKGGHQIASEAKAAPPCDDQKFKAEADEADGSRRSERSSMNETDTQKNEIARAREREREKRTLYHRIGQHHMLNTVARGLRRVT